MPLCVGNTAMAMGLMEDDTVDKGITDNKEIMDEWKLNSSGRVYWPDPLPSLLQCLPCSRHWERDRPAVGFYGIHPRTSPLVRTASTGMFSL